MRHTEECTLKTDKRSGAILKECRHKILQGCITQGQDHELGETILSNSQIRNGEQISAMVLSVRVKLLGAVIKGNERMDFIT
jgi:hypothetical protein